jgi:hypothetical protein
MDEAEEQQEIDYEGREIPQQLCITAAATYRGQGQLMPVLAGWDAK